MRAVGQPPVATGRGRWRDRVMKVLAPRADERAPPRAHDDRDAKSLGALSSRSKLFVYRVDNMYMSVSQ